MSPEEIIQRRTAFETIQRLFLLKFAVEYEQVKAGVPVEGYDATSKALFNILTIISKISALTQATLLDKQTGISPDRDELHRRMTKLYHALTLGMTRLDLAMLGITDVDIDKQVEVFDQITQKILKLTQKSQDSSTTNKSSLISDLLTQ